MAYKNGDNNQFIAIFYERVFDFKNKNNMLA